MPKGPTWQQIHDDFKPSFLGEHTIEMRHIDRIDTYYRSNGRSEAFFTCPFCSRSVTARTWSLAGGGKRCECGAMIGWRMSLGEHSAYHWIDESKHG